MTDDDLRTRIANTLYQELSVELPAAIRGADAVIAALGLQTEWGIDLTYGGCELDFIDRNEAAERLAEIVEDYGDDPPERAPALMSRYVTEWENNDE